MTIRSRAVLEAHLVLPLFAGALLTLASSMPAYADAITYRGTMSDIPILVELTDPADGRVVGQFTFLDVGADVPLYQMSEPGAALVLAQAEECGEDFCPAPDYGQLPVLGEQWLFDEEIGAEHLTGTWQVPAGTTLTLELERVGQRPYRRDEEDLYAGFVEQPYDVVLSAEATPYDYFKMQVPYDGEARNMSGGSYHTVTDPRTKFPFPRVLTLANGADIGPVNSFLEQMHWSVSLDALDCLSDTYLSGGFNTARQDGYSGLGDYDFESISVLYLSPIVMTIVRGGSVSCGSASPFNHAIYTNIDVASGTIFDLGKVFAGWVQAENGLGTADAALLDYVLTNRPKDPSFDLDCGIDEGLANGGLAISFLEGERAQFRLVGTGQAACDGSLFDVALSDIPELLTPEAAKFFPSQAKR